MTVTPKQQALLDVINPDFGEHVKFEAIRDLIAGLLDPPKPVVAAVPAAPKPVPSPPPVAPSTATQKPLGA